MKRKCLREDVAAGLVAHGVDAVHLFGGDAGELALDAGEFDEAGVDLLFDGIAQGILLGDKLFGLVVFHLLFEASDALGLGFVSEGDFRQFRFKQADGGGFSLA